jgi:hypothetical protein
MHRILIIISLFIIYVAGCAPKLATKGSTNDYSEDVSAFRPKIESDDPTNSEIANPVKEKGPYVPPTHDINREMSVLMDSIIVNNQEKMYETYTLQVYIGRSREEANQEREKVYRLLPEEEPTLSYRQPSWIVTVGKYFDRVDAYKTLTTLKSSFPGVTLVRERNYLD